MVILRLNNIFKKKNGNLKVNFILVAKFRALVNRKQLREQNLLLLKIK